jgi:aminopeptidase YwaD
MRHTPLHTLPSVRRLALLPLLALALSSCQRPTVLASPARGVDTSSVRVDVAHLASPALEGRGTGTPGNDSAAVYIARRFASLGLEPLMPGQCASLCAADYLQPFEARSAAAAHAGLSDRLATNNVVGVVRGSDPALRNEYVVVGAHFDHLGRHTFGALDPDARDAIRHGADDNASGTAAVMELARLLTARPPRRSVIFAAFSGEELGLLGSQHFVQHAPVPLEHMVAMINFDMVGRLREGKLIVYGVATAPEFPAHLDSANATVGLDIRGVGDGFGPSDHASFYARDIPVLHFFTDLHDDYHRATDVAERIDVAGIGQVVQVAEGVIRGIADAGARPTLVRVAAPPAARTGGGSGAYLGSIPDMSASDANGVRLTGVRAGSPAEQAGIQAGDVVVEFGGRTVGDLYEYTDALNAHQPGDTVSVVVLRGTERLTLRVTLGRRGG